RGGRAGFGPRTPGVGGGARGRCGAAVVRRRAGPAGQGTGAEGVTTCAEGGHRKRALRHRRREGEDAPMSTSDDDFPQTMDQVRTDIELTRQELGETARELFYRLNVGERAKERFQDRSQTVLRVLR